MMKYNDNMKKVLLTADALWLFNSINQILIYRIYTKRQKTVKMDNFKN